jgi:hypothetical protein
MFVECDFSLCLRRQKKQTQRQSDWYAEKQPIEEKKEKSESRISP